MTTALVTGANKGLGFGVARALGGMGIKVWMGAREEGRGLAAAAQLRAGGADTEYVALDVTDNASIERAVRRIGVGSNGLDILVNNAGIMVETQGAFPDALLPSQVPVQLLRQQYETNFLGAVALIQATLPLLRRSSAARIVNVTARMGSFAYKTDQTGQRSRYNLVGYSSSKAALNMATVVFARELRGTAIKINAVSPGIIATDLSGTSAGDLADRPGFGTPEEGARPIVKYATLPDDGPSGGFFGPDGEMPW
jgi:NAD(P)-dependent dehydrogenase (short-subunit alcohol dehydrogenase family)